MPSHKSHAAFKLIFIGINVLNENIIYHNVIASCYGAPCSSLVEAVCLPLYACSWSVFKYFHMDILGGGGKAQIQIHIVIETSAIIVVVSPTEIIRNIFMWDV